MAGTAWYNFSPGQTTSAAQMNSNLDWLEGDLHPHVGGVKANNLHDLGTATNSWRYARAIYAIVLGGTNWGDPGVGGQDPVNNAAGIEIDGSQLVRIAATAVRGTTANSGGSQREIAQGTISTPDIRDDAVTEIQNAGAGSQATGTTITTVQIATLGSPVLVMAHASIQMTADNNTQADIDVSIDRDGNAITGGKANMAIKNEVVGTNASMHMHLTVNCLETPTAGTHNYNLRYTINNGSISSVVAYEMTVLELRK